MALADILPKINAALADVASRIEAREATYFTNHGRYWQGIMTPATVPLDGADTAPDLTLRPTDQLEDWTNFNLPATIPFAIGVMVHQGPLGWAFTEFAIARTSAEGYWIRTKNVGPYGRTTAGWDRLVPRAN